MKGKLLILLVLVLAFLANGCDKEEDMNVDGDSTIDGDSESSVDGDDSVPDGDKEDSTDGDDDQAVDGDDEQEVEIDEEQNVDGDDEQDVEVDDEQTVDGDDEENEEDECSACADLVGDYCVASSSGTGCAAVGFIDATVEMDDSVDCGLKFTLRYSTMADVVKTMEGCEFSDYEIVTGCTMNYNSQLGVATVDCSSNHQCSWDISKEACDVVDGDNDGEDEVEAEDAEAVDGDDEDEQCTLCGNLGKCPIGSQCYQYGDVQKVTHPGFCFRECGLSGKCAIGYSCVDNLCLPTPEKLVCAQGMGADEIWAVGVCGSDVLIDTCETTEYCDNSGSVPECKTTPVGHQCELCDTLTGACPDGYQCIVYDGVSSLDKRPHPGFCMKNCKGLINCEDGETCAEGGYCLDIPTSFYCGTSVESVWAQPVCGVAVMVEECEESETCTQNGKIATCDK